MKNNILRFSIYGLLALVCFFTAQLAQVPPALYLEANAHAPLNLYQTLTSLGIYWLIIGLNFILAVFLKIIKPKEKLSLPKIALFVLVGEVVIWVINIIGVLISVTMGDDIVSSNQTAINQLMSLLPTSIIMTMAVFGAPIIEEVVFRGLIPRMFSEKWNWIGYLMGAVLFGLAHNPNTLGAGIQYIGMGLVLSAVTYFSKRIEYSILLHFLNNGIAFVLMLSQMN